MTEEEINDAKFAADQIVLMVIGVANVLRCYVKLGWRPEELVVLVNRNIWGVIIPLQRVSGGPICPGIDYEGKTIHGIRVVLRDPVKGSHCEVREINTQAAQ